MHNKTVLIRGREVPIEEILEVYVDGSRWMVQVYGEQAVEIDVPALDAIIELNSDLVEPSIIEARNGGQELLLG